MVSTPTLAFPRSVLSVLADRSASTSAAPTAITLGANSMSRVWSARRSSARVTVLYPMNDQFKVCSPEGKVRL